MQARLHIYTTLQKHYTMIITIGRQLAAGGREVGKQLAKQLNLHYYDRSLLAVAARESGIAEDLFSAADEQYNIFTMALKADNQELFQIQSEVIQHLAEKGNCLFVGRAADYVLRERHDLLSVFLTANTEDRIQRIMKGEHLSEKEAKNFIGKADRRRSDYYNFYTGKQWGCANGYDLCINTSRLSIPLTVQLIAEAANKIKEAAI